LKPGERVVINGLMRVRPGMKVVAQTATMVPTVASLNAPRSTP